ncbi:hypothetical protein ACH5RR_031115 [Cinchona calisaya]|uniref:Uncharacterized protein n=1 Tax=Cinchona calisaya TaxID=153742 RepID=A0ABD2YFA4_9GENT
MGKKNVVGARNRLFCGGFMQWSIAYNSWNLFLLVESFNSILEIDHLKHSENVKVAGLREKRWKQLDFGYYCRPETNGVLGYGIVHWIGCPAGGRNFIVPFNKIIDVQIYYRR